MVFAILSHACLPKPRRRQGRLWPAAIGFGQLPLKATFHAIEHPKALLINDPIFQPAIDVHLSPEPRTLNPEPSRPE